MLGPIGPAHRGCAHCADQRPERLPRIRLQVDAPVPVLAELGRVYVDMDDPARRVLHAVVGVVGPVGEPAADGYDQVRLGGHLQRGEPSVQPQRAQVHLVGRRDDPHAHETAQKIPVGQVFSLPEGRPQTPDGAVRSGVRRVHPIRQEQEHRPFRAVIAAPADICCFRNSRRMKQIGGLRLLGGA